jgi:hypothetical protein
MIEEFSYSTAFSRNLGWIAPAEQQRLRAARIAVAGLGGVGGAHVLTLARLGIEHFHLADFDRFDLPNFNRQAGAFVSTIGQTKVDVTTQMVRDVNPGIQVRPFPDGVTSDNLDAFLDGVDVYVDGLDFFAMETRRQVFAACAAKGIPALTAAPIGMGVALLYFKAGAMSFEEYFRFECHDRQEQFARLIAGLSPAMLQRSYLVVPEAVDFPRERVPSTIMACDLCAGVMGVQVLKILLGRGPLRAAPWGMQWDAYRQKFVFTWRPLGNANPLQQLLLMLIRPKLRGSA